jgi:hypothetical protein
VCGGGRDEQNMNSSRRGRLAARSGAAAAAHPRAVWGVQHARTRNATVSTEMGDVAPTSSFSALRLKEPLMGYAPVKEPKKFAMPSATYSWLGLKLGWRCLETSALAMAMDSRLATSVMMMAPVSSSPETSEKWGLRPDGGSPNVPVMASARSRGHGLATVPQGVTASARKDVAAAAFTMGTQPGLSLCGVYVFRWPRKSVVVMAV